LLKNKSSQSAGACHSRTTAGCVTKASFEVHFSSEAPLYWKFVTWSTAGTGSAMSFVLSSLVDEASTAAPISHTCVLTYVGIIIDYFVILFLSTNY